MNKLRKKYVNVAIVPEENEMIMAKGMLAFLTSHERELGIQDEVTKFRAMLQSDPRRSDSWNVHIAYEEMAFLMKQVAPKGCIYAPVNGQFGFWEKWRVAA